MQHELNVFLQYKHRVRAIKQKFNDSLALCLTSEGPCIASASWPSYGDVQPFTGAAKLVGYPVFVSKYVRRLISK